MKTVAVMGLGLMGGSLGLALKARGLARVQGYARRAETCRAALDLGAVDQVFDRLDAAVADADVTVFCTPVLTIPELIRQCRPAFKPGSVVTDVGSTKAELVAGCSAALAGSAVRFVGSHPMAGSEQTGIEAARVDLYAGAVVAITPGVDAAEPAVAAVAALWSGVGGRVVRLDAAEHDRLVARTSHLPHLVAALLVGTVGRDAPAHLGDFCGTGFRDTTRVADGSPEVWHDIVKSNRVALLAELRAYDAGLGDLINLLERDDGEGVRAFLETSRTCRRALLPGKYEGNGV